MVCELRIVYECVYIQHESYRCISDKKNHSDYFFTPTTTFASADKTHQTSTMKIILYRYWQSVKTLLLLNSWMRINTVNLCVDLLFKVCKRIEETFGNMESAYNMKTVLNLFWTEEKRKWVMTCSCIFVFIFLELVERKIILLEKFRTAYHTMHGNSLILN